MNNAPTAGGRGNEGPHEAEPFFPSEGTFNPVVPLSEIGGEPGPAPLPALNAADVGRPAEAAWAREAHRAALKEEETLVPSRARSVPVARQSWGLPAAVVALSVLAGLISGVYLIRSTQRAAESKTPARVEAEAPSLPPPPVVEEAAAEAEVETLKEAAAEVKSSEVAKAESPREVTPRVSTDESSPPTPRPAPSTRAERPARAAAEAREVTPTPKPARVESPAPARTRLRAAAKQTPPPARDLPISSPPPSAKSRKVIQWP
jgi:hypothetical protein